jgi:hypothetical protein
MLYFGGVADGEGIAGRAGIGIGTTTMQGCVGMVFLTRDFSYGGLFHCPASGSDNTLVQATIRRMLNDISPGIIVITPAQAAGATNSDPLGISRVKAFLRLVWPAAEIGVAKAASVASLHWRSGKPEVNTSAPEEAKYRAIPEALRKMHHPVGRELLGGATYYGGRVKEAAHLTA